MVAFNLFFRFNHSTYNICFCGNQGISLLLFPKQPWLVACIFAKESITFFHFVCRAPHREAVHTDSTVRLIPDVMNEI